MIKVYIVSLVKECRQRRSQSRPQDPMPECVCVCVGVCKRSANVSSTFFQKNLCEGICPACLTQFRSRNWPKSGPSGKHLTWLYCWLFGMYVRDPVPVTIWVQWLAPAHDYADLTLWVTSTCNKKNTHTQSLTLPQCLFFK